MSFLPPPGSSVHQLLDDLHSDRSNIADVVSKLETNLTSRWEERREEHRKAELGRKSELTADMTGPDEEEREKAALAKAAQDKEDEAEKARMNQLAVMEAAAAQAAATTAVAAEQARARIEQANAELQAKYLREAVEERARREILETRLRTAVDDMQKREDREAELKEGLEKAKTAHQAAVDRLARQVDRLVGGYESLLVDLQPRLGALSKRVVVGHLISLADEHPRIATVEKAYRDSMRVGEPGEQVEDLGGDRERTANANAGAGRTNTGSERKTNSADANAGGIKIGSAGGGNKPDGASAKAAGGEDDMKVHELEVTSTKRAEKDPPAQMRPRLPQFHAASATSPANNYSPMTFSYYPDENPGTPAEQSYLEDAPSRDIKSKNAGFRDMRRSFDVSAATSLSSPPPAIVARSPVVFYASPRAATSSCSSPEDGGGAHEHDSSLPGIRARTTTTTRRPPEHDQEAKTAAEKDLVEELRQARATLLRNASEKRGGRSKYQFLVEDVLKLKDPPPSGDSPTLSCKAAPEPRKPKLHVGAGGGAFQERSLPTSNTNTTSLRDKQFLTEVLGPSVADVFVDEYTTIKDRLRAKLHSESRTI